MIFWRKCKKCGEHFDIGINYDLCPRCRVEVNDGRKRIHKQKDSS